MIGWSDQNVCTHGNTNNIGVYEGVCVCAYVQTYGERESTWRMKMRSRRMTKKKRKGGGRGGGGACCPPSPFTWRIVLREENNKRTKKTVSSLFLNLLKKNWICFFCKKIV